MKSEHGQLVEALTGMFGSRHGELAELGLDQISFLDQRITKTGAGIGAALAQIPASWGVDADGTAGPDAGQGPDAPVLPAAARLAEIPGISQQTAMAIIAGTGLDMTRFPDAAHLVSWAGLCPVAGNSGSRTRKGKKKKGNACLRAVLGQAAGGAARTGTFLGERYQRIARRRGKAKAQVAVARSILGQVAGARCRYLITLEFPGSCLPPARGKPPGAWLPETLQLHVHQLKHPHSR